MTRARRGSARGAARLAPLRDEDGKRAAIDVPALVIHGEQDRVVPHANGALLARRLPRADFVSLPQAGHLPFLEDPAAFAGLVRERLG